MYTFRGGYQIDGAVNVLLVNFRQGYWDRWGVFVCQMLRSSLLTAATDSAASAAKSGPRPSASAQGHLHLHLHLGTWQWK